MSKVQKIKKVASALPDIIQYRSRSMMLQASIKPQVKISTSSAIKVLKDVAYKHKIVSLSANQIGLEERVFVALKPQFMSAGKWKNYDEEFQKFQIKNGEEGYEAIISAVQTSSSFEHYYGYEECPSLIGLKFKVKIPLLINIKYITQKALKEYLDSIKNLKPSNNIINIPQNLYNIQKLTGFKGRVWDHQIRHLEGLLPIQQKISRGAFYLLDEYKDSLENIQYYEELQQIYRTFQQKNLKKMQKERQEQWKKRKQAKPRQNVNDFRNIMEQINDVIPEKMRSQKAKNLQLKKTAPAESSIKKKSTKYSNINTKSKNK